MSDELQKLADKYGLPSITTWKQGVFIDSPRYSHMDEEWKEEARAHEHCVVRPGGGTNNALFQVLGGPDPASIVAYLQELGELLAAPTKPDCEAEMTQSPNTPAPAAGSEELHPKFLDIIENGWASESNPRKYGYYLKTIHRSGRLNPGKYFTLTNGKGDFWETNASSKMKIVGSFGDELITAQNDATYAAVMEAIGEDDIEAHDDICRYKQRGKCDCGEQKEFYQNQLRSELRQTIAQIFGVNHD